MGPNYVCDDIQQHKAMIFNKMFLQKEKKNRQKKKEKILSYLNKYCHGTQEFFS